MSDREKARKRKQRQRERETEEQKMTNKRKNRISTSNWRDAMNEHERTIERIKTRSRKRRTKETETSEDRKARKERQRAASKKYRLRKKRKSSNNSYSIPTHSKSIKSNTPLPKNNNDDSNNSDNGNEDDSETERRLRHNSTAHSARDQRISNESHQQRRQRRHTETAQRRNRNFGGLVKAAIFDLSDLDEGSIPEYRIGELSAICQFCGAKHFELERPSDKLFTHCCHKGKIYLAPPRPPPLYIQNLFTKPKRADSKNFLEHIRKYNNAFSMASFGTTMVQLSPGPRQFKIQGVTYHKVSTAHPQENEERRFSQVYFLDPNEALNNRISNPTHKDCKENIFKKIDALIRINNNYVKSYSMMFEVERNAHAEALRTNTPIRPVYMDFVVDKNTDRRRYNAPTTSTEVAIIYQANESGEPPNKRDLRVYSKGGQLQQLNILSQFIDPLVYPMFFFYGENGWNEDLKHIIPGTQNTQNITYVTKRLTQLQFICYKIAIRNEFNVILHGRRLFQQYLCDEFIRIEGNRLNYIKHHQPELLSASYSGLMDHVRNIANGVNGRVGRMVILPSSFTGSPRAMQQLYQDAISVVAKYGKPDLFVTMTCNKNWEEIVENLFPEQIPEDRPDIICRVFRLKLKELLVDIKDRHVFGKVIAWMYSIEFQKRGLPHAHILVILASDSKIHTAEDVDKIVSAEIPCKDRFPRLFEAVTKFMIHTPCGSSNGNPNAPCLNENGECTKHFGPDGKPYCERTQTDKNGYPLYKRSPNNYILMQKKEGRGFNRVDSRFVVPYNPYLLLKFKSHINFELCFTVESIKYIYKYIYKGSDQANMRMSHDKQSNPSVNHDEVSDYLNCRYLSSIEAAWRLLEYPLHDQSHNVIRLAVHLENEQYVTFAPGQETRALNRSGTTLTGWFELNQRDPSVQNLFYIDIPNYFVFENSKKAWKPRSRGEEKVIARMYSVSPSDIQRFSLRLLLLTVPGATSFEYLRTFNGTVYPTFQAAAKARGLLQDEAQYEKWLQEAAQEKLPEALRKMFCFILIHIGPSNGLELWNKFKDEMTDDFDRDANIRQYKYDYGLKYIQQILSEHNKSLLDFQLPNPERNLPNPDISSNTQQHIIAAQTMKAQLNAEQAAIFTEIMDAVNNQDPNVSKCFFIDSPGGSGKTFLLNTIIHEIKGNGQKVGVSAATGIAATLFPDGQTVHSLFGVPLNLSETSISTIQPGSDKWIFLEESNTYILDEGTNPHVHVFMCIDRLLKHLKENDTPFGGSVIIVSGDHRQTLPVVRRGDKSKIIDACMKVSSLWRHFKVLRLKRNMRANAGQARFAKLCLAIGDGKYPVHRDFGPDTIKIPPSLISSGKLIEEIFGDTLTNGDFEELSKRVILCPKNKESLMINEEIQKLLPGNSKIYYSRDETENDVDVDPDVAYPTEYLNSITPSGMPPHKLELKVGSIIMLLRKLSTAKGLCNGTRLVVEKLLDNFIIARKLTGRARTPGDICIIPRISINPTDSGLPFKLKRFQFPVRLSFAMTISKSQGQTFDHVGIFLSECCFGHGQLYVAISRSRSMEGVKFYIIQTSTQGKLKRTGNEIFTRNIVYKELLV